MPSRANINAVRNSISLPRLRTFENYLGSLNRTGQEALALYTWNVQISSAFLNPLHIFEVTIRNVVSEVIEGQYGANWPWSIGFERSLPNPRRGYSMKENLGKSRNNRGCTNKVIPELDFIFWQTAFTRRFDGRLWAGQIKSKFPNSPVELSEERLRNHLYEGMGDIRKLRNRIAHHEPIFEKDLQSSLNQITEIIKWKCEETANWMMRNQIVTDLLSKKPQFAEGSKGGWYDIGK